MDRPNHGVKGDKILIIGLTGGIACGKSTVAASLRRRGIPVVDADQLARDVVEPGEPAFETIVRKFGAEVLDERGFIDRRALGKQVFEDPALRKQLESILHPAIAQRSQQAMAMLRDRGCPVVFYEAALLVEAGTHKALPMLVVVTARLETQRARLLARDRDLSPDDVDGRIAAQLPLSEKESVADIVLVNDGTVETLEAQVETMLQRIQQMSSVDDG